MRSSITRLWLPALAPAALVALLDRNSDAGDLVYFVHRGETMLSAHWRDTFASSTLQSGPLQLLLAGAVRSLPALSFVVEVGVAALLVFALGRLSVPNRWRLAAAVGAVAMGLTHGAFVDGHPAEVVSPLLWVVAATEARRARTGRAGLLIAVATGFELWGILGVVVLGLAPRVGEAMRGVLVAVSTSALMLAPFALFGSFHMFDYQWRVAPGTLLGHLVGTGIHFGWPLRLLQAGVACGVGGAVALRLRRSVHSVWLVPLVVVIARIALDPLAYGWYWLEAEALALVGGALILTVPPSPVRAALRRRAEDRPLPSAPPPPARS